MWFYDLSAGPENWGGSYDVDNADLDGDGVADYRIPVSWEYGHYRPKPELAGDLGKVVRYVGLDLLFTTSPLYPPYFTADRLPAASTSTSTRSRAGRASTPRAQYVKPTCSSTRSASSRPASR